MFSNRCHRRFVKYTWNCLCCLLFPLWYEHLFGNPSATVSVFRSQRERKVAPPRFACSGKVLPGWADAWRKPAASPSLREWGAFRVVVDFACGNNGNMSYLSGTTTISLLIVEPIGAPDTNRCFRGGAKIILFMWWVFRHRLCCSSFVGDIRNLWNEKIRVCSC